ncbi:MAG: nitroreductase family deazaflavin-dependent oxidoreductase [Ktedonobacteraceae bacterium]
MTFIPPSKPTGFLKWAFTLPRYLYRWHLGWLLGHLCLMITHIGRKTGQRRQTVLEIIQYDPSIQECIVMAGWGAQSDWYRNIQSQPAVEVQVGRLRYRPQQRLLSSEETLAILQEYPRRHPFRAHFLLPLLTSLVGVAYDGTPEGLRNLSQYFRGVAFRP